jgi:hypothetical protein
MKRAGLIPCFFITLTSFSLNQTILQTLELEIWHPSVVQSF